MCGWLLLRFSFPNCMKYREHKQNYRDGYTSLSENCPAETAFTTQVPGLIRKKRRKMFSKTKFQGVILFKDNVRDKAIWATGSNICFKSTRPLHFVGCAICYLTNTLQSGIPKSKGKGTPLAVKRHRDLRPGAAAGGGCFTPTHLPTPCMASQNVRQ